MKIYIGIPGYLVRLLNLVILMVFLFIGNVFAANVDPLPSWNDGEAKKAILEFVKEVTREGGANYIAPKDRIATFDEDGTLWVEQPIYVEFFFALENIKAMASQHPEWANTEPFKSAIIGKEGAINKFTIRDFEELISVTHSGISIDAFHDRVNAWLKTAVHPRFKKPFTELVYKPMLEVMQYLRNNQFQIYIVSGGGQEFIRSFAERLYGLPPGHVIGTVGKLEYEYRDGDPILLKLPEVLFINDKEGKPEGINLVIGQRPVIAFGNSVGDRQMLEWTQATKGKNLQLLVHHDDDVREYEYGPDSKIGTFSDSLMDEAKKQGWFVISMKKDWKTIFSWETTPQPKK